MLNSCHFLSPSYSCLYNLLKGSNEHAHIKHLTKFWSWLTLFNYACLATCGCIIWPGHLVTICWRYLSRVWGSNHSLKMGVCFATNWHITAREEFITVEDMQIRELKGRMSTNYGWGIWPEPTRISAKLQGEMLACNGWIQLLQEPSKTPSAFLKATKYLKREIDLSELSY